MTNGMGQKGHRVLSGLSHKKYPIQVCLHVKWSAVNTHSTPGSYVLKNGRAFDRLGTWMISWNRVLIHSYYQLALYK